MKMILFSVLLTSLTSFAANPKFDLVDTAGKTIGSGVLKENPNGLTLSLDLKGVQPGKHAIHLHQNGKCEGPKFETAGSHLNPHGKKHGHESAEGPHLGDLGNIEVPANGNFKGDVALKGLNLKAGDQNSVMTASGTSLVIHAKFDDEKTDPSGAAGDRIYCGVLAQAQAASSTK